MIRGTTPTHTFILPFSTEIVSAVRVIYKQGETEVLCKCETDCEKDGNAIKVRLTQEETLEFDCKKDVKIQLRVLTMGGDALASKPRIVDVGECLNDEVLE